MALAVAGFAPSCQFPNAIEGLGWATKAVSSMAQWVRIGEYDMTVTVGIYDKALTRLKGRLDSLALDISLLPFDRSTQFVGGDGLMAPENTELDYLWLSPDINLDGLQMPVFDMVLKCKRIGVLQTFNAGLDHPVYKQVSDKGVRISNSSAQATAISEYVVAQVLNSFHPMHERRELQSRGEWKRTPFREISGTNWLIVGFGPIGRATAKLAKAFGASIMVVRRSPATSDIVDRSGTISEISSYLQDTDVIVLACPLNAETRGFANADFFAAVKEGATLVNIARGALIDDTALIGALDNGRLATAILDVFHEEPLPTTSPLWSHPKVRITAHTSFSGSGTRTRWDELFLVNIARFAAGEPLVNEVDPADIQAK
ncbi:MAG: D-2-hydroxyacid dehydrogenase [Hyphomicrobiaceae bacterium]